MDRIDSTAIANWCSGRPSLWLTRLGFFPLIVVTKFQHCIYSSAKEASKAHGEACMTWAYKVTDAQALHEGIKRIPRHETIEKKKSEFLTLHLEWVLKLRW